ncbi:MAG: MFS transporter [Candidatus Bathyarchaeota archaeon]|nr:MFS transporter [Candidatus Bathyarchaeota archaeon]
MGLSKRLFKDSFLSGNYLLLIVTWILMFSTQSIPLTYSSLYFVNLNGTPFLLSVMFFISSLIIAFVQIPGGYLTDKNGRKWLIATMSFGWAIGYLFFVFAPSWHFIVIGIAIQSFCMMYMPALTAMMLDSLKPNQRGLGFNFQAIILAVITLPAPLIAAALVLVNGEYVVPQSNHGMRIAYAIVLVAYLVAATLRLKLKETLPDCDSIGRPQVLQAFKKYPQIIRESWAVWGKVPKSALYIFLTNLGINGLVASCQIYFVLYVTEHLGLSAFDYSLAMTIMNLSLVLPALLAGLKIDGIGRKRFLVLGYALHVPAMLLFVVSDFYLLLVAFFLFGLGNMLRFNTSQIMLGDVIPRALRGKALGFQQFFLSLTQAFIYLLIGYLYSYIEPSLPFLLLAIAAIPIGLIAAFKIHEQEHKEI